MPNRLQLFSQAHAIIGRRHIVIVDRISLRKMVDVGNLYKFATPNNKSIQIVSKFGFFPDSYINYLYNSSKYIFLAV